MLPPADPGGELEAVATRRVLRAKAFLDHVSLAEAECGANPSPLAEVEREASGDAAPLLAQRPNTAQSAPEHSPGASYSRGGGGGGGGGGPGWGQDSDQGGGWGHSGGAFDGKGAGGGKGGKGGAGKGGPAKCSGAGSDVVWLGTVHQSKRLEWPVVFVVRFNEVRATGNNRTNELTNGRTIT